MASAQKTQTQNGCTELETSRPWHGKPISWWLYVIWNSHYVSMNFCTVFDTLIMD